MSGDALKPERDEPEAEKAEGDAESQGLAAAPLASEQATWEAIQRVSVTEAAGGRVMVAVRKAALLEVARDLKGVTLDEVFGTTAPPRRQFTVTFVRQKVAVKASGCEAAAAALTSDSVWRVSCGRCGTPCCSSL